MKMTKLINKIACSFVALNIVTFMKISYSVPHFEVVSIGNLISTIGIISIYVVLKNLTEGKK